MHDLRCLAHRLEIQMVKMADLHWPPRGASGMLNAMRILSGEAPCSEHMAPTDENCWKPEDHRKTSVERWHHLKDQPFISLDFSS
eukprot:s535_g16.t1